MFDALLALIEASPLRHSLEAATEYVWGANTSWFEAKVLISQLSSYLITTQVGILGVVSLALALITLIAQRENSATDIQVYYHESMAFEIFASSLALLAILVLQLTWPLQSLVHYLGFGSESSVFEATLLGAHFAWLLVNLGAISRFVSTTFSFVQQSARELHRERYTANIIQPLEMRRYLRNQLYALTGHDLTTASGSNNDQPSAVFGSDYGNLHAVEIESTFRTPVLLHDVRIIWVRWVLRRWVNRCNKKIEEDSSQDSNDALSQGPLISFSPNIDVTIEGRVAWCRRRGGVPLTRLEKFVLRRAFRFKRVRSNA
ncbi:hypothetical protein RXV86_12380 [Alisedimentitalea sp. MJ-SS2]|uniref:hypothetical protein n=1 Tax=Aliisedimentitalea sp. MJ-SS2 TaxID=3049795 RepID=UPI0029123E21|nr:hypothetical protein [Alisedimentitalea sp. MJ-SS2]MDU8928185.1 hypothetical protein [Alisedimentitalea sp. MJ-SS2]